MRHTWIANALRIAGLPVIEQPGWQTRGADMEPIWGVMCHHTAGGGSNDWVIVQNGRAGLAGPLAHMTLERNGTFRVIAAGRCNHAGLGRWPGLPDDGANSRVIGIEGVSNGTSWTDEQRINYPRGVAALLNAIKVGQTRVIGHKEWAPNRKVDPGNWDMQQFRQDVNKWQNANAVVVPPIISRKNNLLLLESD